MSFEKWLATMKDHQKKTLEACEKTINTSIREMGEKLIERTPLGDPSLWHYPAPKGYHPGTLRASWEFNTRGVGRDVKTGKFKSQSNTTGNESNLEQWAGIKLQTPAPQAVTIANRQPYAWRVEYGSWSTQAPQGMLRITLLEYNGILEKNTRRNKL